MKYGSIVCRTTMLLILIKLKEAYPDVIESFMKDEVSILQSPVLLPKERELLLRLLISYLPPSAVLSVIQNSSPSSSASIIHSLCHLPVDVLLEEYLSVESGLLNTDDSLVVDSIVDLLIAIARHSSHFQRIQLIQILFKRMHKSKKNTAAFLQCVSSLLENTYYITSSSEQELLVQFAQEEALREPSLRVLSLCVLPTMSDVKSVGEATHTTQLQWVGQSLLCSSSSVSITHISSPHLSKQTHNNNTNKSRSRRLSTYSICLKMFVVATPHALSFIPPIVTFRPHTSASSFRLSISAKHVPPTT